MDNCFGFETRTEFIKAAVTAADKNVYQIGRLEETSKTFNRNFEFLRAIRAHFVETLKRGGALQGRSLSGQHIQEIRDRSGRFGESRPQPRPKGHRIEHAAH